MFPYFPVRRYVAPVSRILFPAFMLVALSFPLAACGGKQQAASQPQEQGAPVAPIMDFMTRNPAGASAVLDDPEFGEGIRVVVEGAFTSATNEECRRATLLSPHGEAEVIIACRPSGAGGSGAGDGAWQMAPRIWGQGIPRPQ